jgi:O-antigen/teichoic acid export membrane protein
MTSGRVLTRNALYSIVGQVLPLLAAFVAIRFLIPGLGDVRFGVLTLAWAAAGYFSIFDFGLGRAVTHAVAIRLGTDATADLSEVAWSALVLMGALGFLGMAVVLIGTPLLVRHLGVPEALQLECRRSFYLIAITIPWMVATGGLRGIIEAHGDFRISMLLRVPLALTAFLGPLVVLRFTARLEPIMLVLLGGRILVFGMHLGVCLRRYPFMRKGAGLKWAVVGPLIRFGGWTTLINVIAPLMTQLDRFAVAFLLTVDVATYYVPPFEVATKLWVVPVAVTAVLFPKFTSSFATDRAGMVDLVDVGLRALTALLFPLALVLVAFAPEILRTWLGSPDVAAHGVPVLRWLTAGAFVIGVGHVPASALQGANRPDLVAKLQLVELPLYWGGLWWLTKELGLPGVAIASAARMVIDTAGSHMLTHRIVPGTTDPLLRSAMRLSLLTAVLGTAALPERLIIRSALVAIVLVGFAVYTWTVLIRSRERTVLARSVGL